MPIPALPAQEFATFFSRNTIHMRGDIGLVVQLAYDGKKSRRYGWAIRR